MYKSLSTFFVFAAMLLTICSTTAQAKEEVFEFSFQSMLPDNHVVNNYFLKWGEEIKEKSNGRLIMNMFPNASVTRYDKALTGVQGGVVDMGMASVNFNQNSFPYSQVMSLPFISRDAEHATKILWEIWKASPEFQAEFKDSEVLTMWCVDRSVLLSTKNLIKQPSDLKGKRVLIGSGSQATEINAWGGNSVVIAATDAYVGLQRGMGEVSYGQLTAVAPFKLYEVAKHITIVPASLSSVILIVNNDFMNDLPPDLQAILRDSMGEKMGIEIGQIMKNSGDADMAMMKSKNIDIYVPTDEEIAKFRALSMEATMPEWKKIFVAGGMKDPDAWIKKIYDIAATVE